VALVSASRHLSRAPTLRPLWRPGVEGGHLRPARRRNLLEIRVRRGGSPLLPVVDRHVADLALFCETGGGQVGVLTPPFDERWQIHPPTLIAT